MTEILLPDKEFFSIGDASRITQLPQYVLRYWESEFRLLRPARRVSGHRKYTKKDIDLILRIKELLHEKKYTIQGAKKYLQKDRPGRSAQQLPLAIQDSAAVEALREIKKELEGLYRSLK